MGNRSFVFIIRLIFYSLTAFIGMLVLSEVCSSVVMITESKIHCNHSSYTINKFWSYVYLEPKKRKNKRQHALNGNNLTERCRMLKNKVLDQTGVSIDEQIIMDWFLESEIEMRTMGTLWWICKIHGFTLYSFMNSKMGTNMNSRYVRHLARSFGFDKGGRSYEPPILKKRTIDTIYNIMKNEHYTFKENIELKLEVVKKQKVSIKLPLVEHFSVSSDFSYLTNSYSETEEVSEDQHLVPEPDPEVVNRMKSQDAKIVTLKKKIKALESTSFSNVSYMEEPNITFYQDRIKMIEENLQLRGEFFKDQSPEDMEKSLEMTKPKTTKFIKRTEYLQSLIDQHEKVKGPTVIQKRLYQGWKKEMLTIDPETLEEVFDPLKDKEKSIWESKFRKLREFRSINIELELAKKKELETKMNKLIDDYNIYKLKISPESIKQEIINLNNEVKISENLLNQDKDLFAEYVSNRRKSIIKNQEVISCNTIKKKKREIIEKRRVEKMRRLACDISVKKVMKHREREEFRRNSNELVYDILLQKSRKEKKDLKVLKEELKKEMMNNDNIGFIENVDSFIEISEVEIELWNGEKIKNWLKKNEPLSFVNKHRDLIEMLFITEPKYKTFSDAAFHFIGHLHHSTTVRLNVRSKNNLFRVQNGVPAKIYTRNLERHLAFKGINSRDLTIRNIKVKHLKPRLFSKHDNTSDEDFF